MGKYNCGCGKCKTYDTSDCCDPCYKKPKCKKGATGPSGPVGSTGSVGPTGPASTFFVNTIDDMGGVITGPLPVTNGDTISFQSNTLDISVVPGSVIVQIEYVGETGPTGPTGIQGPQGAQGPQGIQGPTGVAGAQGPIGPQGVVGPQGPIGPAGPQGLQGNDGPVGPVGPQGAVGPVGPQGPQGIQGPQGNVGATGATGATGSPGAASIIPFATSSTVSTTSVNGVNTEHSLIAFGNQFNGVTLTGTDIELQNFATNLSFILPRSGTLMALYGSISLSAPIVLANDDTITITAALFRAISGSNTFEPLASAVFNQIIAPGSVANVIYSGNNTGLMIPVSAGDRLLYVLSHVSSNASSYTVSGYASGGVSIL